MFDWLRQSLASGPKVSPGEVLLRLVIAFVLGLVVAAARNWAKSATTMATPRITSTVRKAVYSRGRMGAPGAVNSLGNLSVATITSLSRRPRSEAASTLSVTLAHPTARTVVQVVRERAGLRPGSTVCGETSFRPSVALRHCHGRHPPGRNRWRARARWSIDSGCRRPVPL